MHKDQLKPLIEANNSSDVKRLRLIFRSAVDKGDGAIRIRLTIEPTAITNSILQGKQLPVFKPWPDYEANKNFLITCHIPHELATFLICREETQGYI